MDWKRITISPDGTHHLLDGVPLYQDRYDEVLKFHEPGLAPVRKAGAAWHISPTGEAAYDARFLRTFGFYEGLAAVISEEGWHHIRPDGSDFYTRRYAWCGNFQGGRCAVRDLDGAYLHITLDGEAAYPARWCYAGDYRDSIAVVQANDGLSTHIDLDGRLLHEQWFLDLDVFHKGFARARDEQGWTHVDTAGRPGYGRRFAAVEPFYNGQARVERFDGGLEVIDETGEFIVDLRPALRSEFDALSGDMVGFWRTQTICSAVELGVFEVLPGTSDGIADSCGLHPGRTRRLLRALAELKLVERNDDKWNPTERGAYLRTDHPLALADAAREYGRHFPDMWASLPESLRDDSAWRAPDIFGQVAGDPARADGHHRMLQSYALHDYAAVPAGLRLEGHERVIDAGGGLGALSIMLLEHYPELQVVLLDRPEVIDRVARRQTCERLELLAADLFEPWGLTADAVVLARVLHDWDDPKTLQILRNARSALPKKGRVFIVEMLLSEGGFEGGLCDLHLFMATGGAERTANQYAALLSEAGFRFDGVRRIPALPSVLVGVVDE